MFTEDTLMAGDCVQPTLVDLLEALQANGPFGLLVLCGCDKTFLHTVNSTRLHNSFSCPLLALCTVAGFCWHWFCFLPAPVAALAVLIHPHVRITVTRARLCRLCVARALLAVSSGYDCRLAAPGLSRCAGAQLTLWGRRAPSWEGTASAPLVPT